MVPLKLYLLDTGQPKADKGVRDGISWSITRIK